MIIKTTRFGEIEIDENKIIFFPRGILGFPDQRRFVLLPHREDSPFCWLQAVDDPDLTFVVVNPFVINPDYKPEFKDEVLSGLEIEEGDVIDLLSIVTVPRENPQAMTANLLGPIVINVSKRLAKQVVLDPHKYPLKYPLLSGKRDRDEGSEAVG